ncbi:MAG: 30S ribosomal protein S20 [candidate division Zixibacteria bacterium]|nr:30S ribosomal protein S20 [candidate division Zixibacteria bacterium]
MPHHKSCIKRLRQAEKNRIRNNTTRTELKKTLKDARDKVSGKEAIDLKQAYSKIDKVCSKGIIHKKKASRLKSRMAKANAKLAAASN